MRKILLLTTVFFLLLGSAYAQSRRITGKVTSTEDGSPLPGVNVIVKGTITGTSTDAEGNYTIDVPGSDAVISFSFIGLTSLEVAVGERNSIDVSLALDVTQLSEVVVTGYSEVSQRNLVASVGIVNSSAIQNVPMADINQIIQGRATGVQSSSSSGQPGSVQTIRIRGTGSLTAGRNPLYVIDGIIAQTGDFTSESETVDVLANLNPNDIESINILKDAAATSLYGSRGSNGVVLINTKRGKAGTSTLTARVQYGITQKNTGNFKMMNGQQAWDYERDILTLAGLNPDILRPASMLDNTFNWMDAAFQQGKTTNYEVQAQGGNDKTKFFLSGGLFSQDGILIESEFKRYSVRANIDQQLTDKLDFSMNLNVSYTDQLNAVAGNRFGSPLLGSFSTTPLQGAYKPEGGLYTGLENEYIGFTGDNFLYSAPKNPVVNNNLRSIGKINVGYDILKNLKFTQTLAADLISIKEKAFFDPTTADGVTTTGEVDMAYAENFTYTSQSKLSGNYTVGDHSFDGLAVMEYQENDQANFQAYGTGLASPLLKTLNSTAVPLTTSGSNTGSAFFSVLGQVNYNMSDKYFASVSFRRDGSSRFGADNRYASFWSVGASWRLIEESFLSSISVLSDLKLRVSYGTSGNADIANFASLGLYGFGSAYNQLPGSAPSQIANPDLRWEVSNSLNIGLDYGVLNDRIKGTVDFYNRKSEDLLQDVPVSSTSGFLTAFQNVGTIQNRGVELTLSTVNIDGDIRWTTDFNISANRNEVLELNGGEDIRNGRQLISEGRPVRSWNMQKWAGVNPATGAPLWYTQDGGVTSSYALAGRFYVGNAAPDFVGGINNTLSYKGIDLSFFFYYSVGNEVYNGSRPFIESDGQRFGWNHWVEAGKDYWRAPGDIVSRPRPVSGGNASSNSSSTRFLENGSFLRLRNIVLAYNIPTSILTKAGIKNARVYAQGQNLLTITDYTGFDPEMDENGEEFFRYPVGKTITFGVELTF